MDMRLQRLLDESDIRRVLATYCRGIDRCDGEFLSSAFHPDATVNYGLYVGDVAGFVDYTVGQEGRLKREWDATQHTIGTTLIDIEGDFARSEAYFRAVLVLKPRPDGIRLIRELIGRYSDQLERRGGEWRIADRIVVKDWNDLRILTDSSSDQFTPGSRDHSDPTYRSFGPASTTRESVRS